MLQGITGLMRLLTIILMVDGEQVLIFLILEVKFNMMLEGKKISYLVT
jgi:hypothetical protein